MICSALPTGLWPQLRREAPGDSSWTLFESLEVPGQERRESPLECTHEVLENSLSVQCSNYLLTRQHDLRQINNF